MSERRRIEADPENPHRPFSHLVPLVQALLDHGNELARPPRDGGVFSPSQGGWVAYLREPIDWDWVQETFEVPDLLRYNAEDDELFDHKNWISIQGSYRE